MGKSKGKMLSTEAVEDFIDRKVEEALLRKALAGDVRAQMFWLKNRHPELWKDEDGDKSIRENQKVMLRLLNLEAELSRNQVEEYGQDGFIEALNATAREVWGDQGESGVSP